MSTKGARGAKTMQHGIVPAGKRRLQPTIDPGEQITALADEIDRLRMENDRLSDYLREKNEIIKAYAGPTGMTPEDVAEALAILDRMDPRL